MWVVVGCGGIGHAKLQTEALSCLALESRPLHPTPQNKAHHTPKAPAAACQIYWDWEPFLCRQVIRIGDSSPVAWMVYNGWMIGWTDWWLDADCPWEAGDLGGVLGVGVPPHPAKHFSTKSHKLQTHRGVGRLCNRPYDTWKTVQKGCHWVATTVGDDRCCIFAIINAVQSTLRWRAQIKQKNH